jgi:hypothetical protein
MDANNLVLAIHRAMATQYDWSSETLDDVTDLLVQAGFSFPDHNEDEEFFDQNHKTRAVADLSQWIPKGFL